MPGHCGTALLVGLGNPDRHDDGVGPAVAALFARSGGRRVATGVADVGQLLDAWDGARLAVVVDATCGAGRPGTLRVWTPRDGIAGPGAPASSSHSVDVRSALRLGRAVGMAPDQVVVIGVEGRDFTTGRGLSPEVDRAVPAALRAARQVMARFDRQYG